ncbi:sensor histidine kinase [[Clostridium] scindens]|uniref:sensor histidine kinase n=1 Tax=Clostridium scindens (strain JCM 10418 / VPI 12708) TaxID=29347 RepID=UPI001C704A01|nr:histidine kinase [[Clostridium] scindens]QYX26770.1 histidine kinase [[Clostridium] scindens]
MKKSLSSQFVAILLIPLILILATNYYIITEIRRDQSQSLKRYCSTTLDNIEINIASMATSMKKTSTMFSSKQETQSYLQSASTDTHQLQRQSFSDLIGMSQSYTPDLVDIIVWDKNSPTSMISYIPADMENFTVERFRNSAMNKQSYFEFYIQPATREPFLMYFSPVFMTTFSEDFGKYIGNIAIICKTETLSKLVNSTSDMQLQIKDEASRKILYSNNYTLPKQEIPNPKTYEETLRIPNTNLSVDGTAYASQVSLLNDSRSGPLILFALLSLFYLAYIAFAVHHIIIRPIHKLNQEIEAIDYEHDKPQIRTSLKNEIGSIASHVNTLLERVYSLNQHNIASQARLYEMELSKKQTQLYAYQSQINPHFLYNMLQCMRGISLMHGIREVAQICTNMADLFRYSIKGAFLVYLEDELSIIDKYLYMIRVRFQDKITYSLEIAEDTKKCKIPKMILQPLVENSIFHGLESIEDNGFIHIRTFREGDGLFITIQDNGIGFDEVTLKELEELLSQDIPSDINATFNEAKGLGIINIHNKIRLYEGTEYGISILSRPSDTLVTIRLNARQPDGS